LVLLGADIPIIAVLTGYRYVDAVSFCTSICGAWIVVLAFQNGCPDTISFLVALIIDCATIIVVAGLSLQ